MFVDQDVPTVALIGAAIYVAALAFYSRESWRHGLQLTPFYVVVGLYTFLAAPAFFLSVSSGLSDNYVPLAVFITAMVSVTAAHALASSLVPKRIVSETVLARFALSKTELWSVSAVLLAVVLVCFGLIFYEGLPTTVRAAISTLTGEAGAYSHELRDQRLALTKGAYFGGEYKFQGLNNALQSVGWSYLLALASIRFATKKTVANAAMVFTCVILAWLFVAGNGTRGPFLLVLAAGFIAYSLVRPFSWKHLVAMFAILAIVGIFLGSYSHKMSGYFTDGFDIVGALQEIGQRALFGNGSSDVLTIGLAQSGELNFGFGHFHIRDFTASIPGVVGDKPLAYHVNQLLGGEATTFKTGTYLGKVYVDFGMFGVVVIFFMLGVLLRLLEAATNWGVQGLHFVTVNAMIVWLCTAFVTGGPHKVIAESVVLAALVAIHSTLYFVTIFMAGKKSASVNGTPS